MDTQEIEISSRDTFKHYIYVDKPGKVLKWGFNTKKRSIGFGLFYHRNLTAEIVELSPPVITHSMSDLASSQPQTVLTTPTLAEAKHNRRSARLSVTTSVVSTPGKKSGPDVLATRKSTYETPAVIELETIIPIQRHDSSRATIIGSHQALEAGHYALIFDNTFSKTTSKKLTFWVTVTQEDNFKPDEEEPEISGWMLKKKKKRNQGWTKRWVYISKGILSYYKTPKSLSRGSVSILSASISVVSEQRLIVIDSGSLIYYFKAMDDESLENWLKVIRQSRMKHQQNMQIDRDDCDDSTRAKLTRITSKLNDYISPKLKLAESELEKVREFKDKEATGRPRTFSSSSMSDAANGLKKLALFKGKGSPNCGEENAVSAVYHYLAECTTELRDLLTNVEKLLSDIETTSSEVKRPRSIASIYHDAPDGSIVTVNSSQTDLMAELSEAAASEEEIDDEASSFSDDEPQSADSSFAIFVSTPVAIESKVSLAASYMSDLQGSRFYDTVESTRRKQLPSVTPKEDVGIVSILRKNIGKDLATISMPIALNEPLNLLQRLAEEMEYCELLDEAASLSNSIDRLIRVAAFAVSAYYSTQHRASRKPFNPMLGETYELVHEEKGFRFCSEKVSHNPHIMACFADSKNYEFWQDAQSRSKFWGRSIELQPIGTVFVKLKNPCDEIFTWNKVATHCTVIGSSNIEHYGEMIIKNHTTGEQAKIAFKEKGYFSSAKNMIEGSILTASGVEVKKLQGTWSDAIYEVDGDIRKLIWKGRSFPENVHEQYGFTQFAIELNELTVDMKNTLPLTDTRFRPDQRLLEEGNLDAADKEKIRIENKQRESRKQLEAAGKSWQPQFFQKVLDSTTHTELYVSNHAYWKAKQDNAFNKNIQLW